MLDLVGNPEDRFSSEEAQMLYSFQNNINYLLIKVQNVDDNQAAVS